MWNVKGLHSWNWHKHIHSYFFLHSYANFPSYHQNIIQEITIAQVPYLFVSVHYINDFMVFGNGKQEMAAILGSLVRSTHTQR